MVYPGAQPEGPAAAAAAAVGVPAAEVGVLPSPPPRELGDDGLASISRLTGLKELRLEGADRLTDLGWKRWDGMLTETSHYRCMMVLF